MTLPLIAATIALLACLLVGQTARPLLRKMRPGQGVVLLAVASLAASLASGVALTAIAIAVLAGITAVAADGHWSAAVLRSEVPIPGWLGVTAACAVLVLLTCAAARTRKILLALVRADRLCRQIRVDGGPVVVIDDDSADAYTVAGIRGCVVISRRLLAELTADECRVLTAHELSHLYRRHHLYVHIVDIAAAANPLLKPVSAVVRLGVERWADEDAAAGIGDRRVAGRALARVALLRSSFVRAAASAPGGGAGPALGVAALHVAARVQALLAPPPQRRTGRLAVGIVLSMSVLLVGIWSLDNTQDAIEAATPFLQHSHS